MCEGIWGRFYQTKTYVTHPFEILVESEEKESQLACNRYIGKVETWSSSSHVARGARILKIQRTHVLEAGCEVFVHGSGSTLFDKIVLNWRGSSRSQYSFEIDRTLSEGCKLIGFIHVSEMKAEESVRVRRQVAYW